MLTARIARSGLSWCSSSSAGVSCTQGAHQLAQKLSTTTWPRYFARWIELAPSERLKSGAALPICEGWAPRLQPVRVDNTARVISDKRESDQRTCTSL